MDWIELEFIFKKDDEKGASNAKVMVMKLFDFQKSYFFANKSHWIIAFVVEEFSLGAIVVGVFVTTFSIEVKSQKSISNGRFEGNKYLV